MQGEQSKEGDQRQGVPPDAAGDEEPEPAALPSTLACTSFSRPWLIGPQADDEIIRLNVGGHKFETTMETLTKKGEIDLSRAIAGKQMAMRDGWLFVDRDGQYFAPLLEYLRTGLLVVPPHMARASVEREASMFGIRLPECKEDRLRFDGVYITRVNKVLVGFLMFGPGPDARFMHQTTNPLHTYSRSYTCENSLVQWSLGGLANEEQHAIITGYGNLISDTEYAFVPFAPPSINIPYRLLTKKEEDQLNPDVVDSLADDNYKKIKYFYQGRHVIIGEIVFHEDNKLSFKALAKRFRGETEVIEPPPFTLEDRSNICGISAYKFLSEDWVTGVGWMDTKVTKKNQIEILCMGDFLLIRSLTMELSRANKIAKWLPSAETQHAEIFLMFPKAQKHKE